MGRPIYAEQAQLDQGRVVAHLVARQVGLVAIDMPRLFAVNFALVHPDRPDRALAALDVKCRNVASTKYSTSIAGERHVAAALELAAKRPLTYLFAVQFTDGIFVWDNRRIDFAYFRIDMGGRSDRGDPRDQEPVRHFPIHEATPLSALAPL